MHTKRIANAAPAIPLLILLACAAQAQYRPEVPILKCAHEGEPVPDVPGATFHALGVPRIDGAGNVLVNAIMTGAGINPSNDQGLWFGQPGALALVARDGWPAPDLPGVVYSNVAAIDRAVSETGWLEFTTYLSGSGVTPGVNNRAIFCGPPGDFRLVMRTGDPVPELGPDIVISGTETMGAMISDNGTLFIGAGLSGSGLPPTYDRAYWVGPRDGLQLVVWNGMPVQGCPECDPAVYFQGMGDFSFNDAGQVAFDGALAGPGIHWYDGEGHWVGAPGALVMTLRELQLVPEFGPTVSIAEPCGGLYALNSFGDKVERIRVSGVGITAHNEWAIVGGETDPTAIIVRQGDPTPEAGEETYIASVSTPFISNLHRVLYTATLAGPSVTDSSRCAVYYGPYDDPRLILRDGSPADYLLSGTVLHQVGWVQGSVAMNDVGDFAALTSVEFGAEVANGLWVWRGLTKRYVPLVQEGSTVDGRAVTLVDPYGDYWTETGGADGFPQSFNDRRQLAMLLDFTDGTSGVYRIGPPLLGDTDGDGEVGAPELMAFASCAAGPGGSAAPGCEPLDLNLDGTVDLRDLALLQAMVGEER
jgi:hypothetical protein